MAMADGTCAVPLYLIEDGFNKRRSLCPGCTGGLLHPYKVSVGLGGFAGQEVGIGWVAICVGGKAGERGKETDSPRCGFSLPLTAYHHVPHLGLEAEYGPRVSR